jgi:3-isopropylmalate dehydrogenase
MAKEYKIALIPGDGTGPEVIREGVKVVDAAAAKHDIKLDYTTFDFGCERYLKTGKILDDSDIEELKKYDAIYLGALGDESKVKPGLIEKGVLLKTRFDLDQYVNLRPVKLYPGVYTPVRDKGPKEINFTIVRENTEDFYTGMGGIVNPGEAESKMSLKRSLYSADFDIKMQVKGSRIGYQLGVISDAGSERIIRYAFELARANGKKKVTAVDKANVMEMYKVIWREAFEKVSKDYPEMEHNYNYVDACTMWFVKNPENYEVIVVPNMFGDIITDLGAMIQGGMGIAAGGNINPKGVSMFEPMGGSAPKYTGQNVINPLATILAGQMMIDRLGEQKAAQSIEDAVSTFLEKGELKGLSVKDIKESGYSTSKIGDWIADYIAKH